MNFLISAVTLTAFSSSFSTTDVRQSDGIRCRTTNGRINVSTKQWKEVLDALKSHDPNRIAPFISSSKGVIGTSMSGGWGHGKWDIYTNSQWESKESFLQSISQITFHDFDHTIDSGGKSDNIYAWFWISLGPHFFDDDNYTKSLHKRPDVWWVMGKIGGKHFAAGRLRFISDNGWLKVAEIKSIIPPFSVVKYSKSCG